MWLGAGKLEQHLTFKTIEELNPSVPYIMDAPKENGEISKLCYRPGFGERVFVDLLSLSTEEGVIGDRWKEYTWLKLPDGGPDPRNQVCIIPKRTLDCFWKEGDEVIYPGDTMVVDMDMSEQNLPTGTQLQVGTAIIEVSDFFNDACTKWAARHGKQSRQWINAPEHIPLRLRGVFCSIVKDGEVKITDRLKKL